MWLTKNCCLVSNVNCISPGYLYQLQWIEILFSIFLRCKLVEGSFGHICGMGIPDVLPHSFSVEGGILVQTSPLKDNNSVG